jgi:hypothetical protein
VGNKYTYNHERGIYSHILINNHCYGEVMIKQSLTSMAIISLIAGTAFVSSAQAREVEIERHGNHVRPEHVERVEKVEHVEKAERPEKVERVEVEKAERPETEHGGSGHN